MIARRWVLIVAATGAALAAGLVACGVPIDDQPRVIERAATPSSTQPATTVANAKASAHSPANLKLALPTPCSLDRVTGRSQRRLGSGHVGRGI